jgi:VWFA-related protein
MAALWVGMPVRAQSTQPTEPVLVLRITSPIGRTGIPGTIRIVARLDGRLPESAPRVEFYVDKLHLSDDDAPPYEALWTDDNPFERRELSVRAELPSGAILTHSLVLNPLTVDEAVQVNSVPLEASVTDVRGRFVRELTKSDFEVREDGVVQEIDQLSFQRQPSLFMLLVDSSQSMALRFPTVRAAASRLLRSLHPEDVVAVVPFSRGVTGITGPTRDHPTVLQAISAIQPSGGTAILDTLQEVLPRLTSEFERRAIVLITDGYDEHSTSDFDETIAALRKSRTSLYVIGMGGIAGISLKGEYLLTQLAQQTGGRAWFPRDDRRLAEAYATTAEEVQQRYVMTYTPKNQRRDGTWRRITVNLHDPELRVRTREGYTAPLAPPVRASFEFTAVSTGDKAAPLLPDDIEVLEDGVPQKIDAFQEAVLPVTIMLALDSSGSMTRSAEKAMEAARQFVTSMRPEDELGMIMFADKSEYIQLPTLQRDLALAAIDGYKAAGGTALYDAMHESLTRIASIPRRRVIVVVTDGRDENAASNGPGSLRTWDEVLTKLRETEATVYAVGIGSRVDRSTLQELADRSGGAAYFSQDVATLATDYQKILDELRRRYVLGYESTNIDRDGKWRKVEIRTRLKDVIVRSRDGYFAPEQ